LKIKLLFYFYEKLESAYKANAALDDSKVQKEPVIHTLKIKLLIY